MYDIWKAKLAILLMTVSFLMMVELNRVNCLGDYVLEYLNINPWSGDYVGTHLTVVYFGLLFLLSIWGVKKYAIEGMNYSKRTILISFVALVTGFVMCTQLSVDIIKANLDDLRAIGYHSETSVLQYSYKDGELVELVAVFTLENYSNENKEFNISLDSPWYRKDDNSEIQILDDQENKASFKLHPKEKRTFIVSNKDYSIKGGESFNNGGTSGSISELILSNEDEERILLSDKNFFGILLSK